MSIIKINIIMAFTAKTVCVSHLLSFTCLTDENALPSLTKPSSSCSSNHLFVAAQVNEVLPNIW